jgi:aspartate aminotransferase
VEAGLPVRRTQKDGFFVPSSRRCILHVCPLGESLTEKILKQGVIIVPGAAFGCNAPDYARMNYAVARDSLKKAVERIRAAREE